MSLLVLPPDDDIDTLSLRKKKQRGKKFRDKLSCLWAIPIQVLNRTIQGSGAKAKKRQGFSTYKMLSCGECKPPRNFHKRSGVESHRQEIHPGSISAAQKTRNKRLATLPLGPTRRSARLASLHTETNDTEVDTKIPVKSKSVTMVDLDTEIEDESDVEVVWETGYSWTLENTERRRLETDAHYQPTVGVSSMINKLVRDNQKNLRNVGTIDQGTVVDLDSEDYERETVKKESHVRKLNFDSDILRKPYVPVSALEIRRDKKTFVLESSDSDSDVVILDSWESEARRRKKRYESE